MYFALNCKQIIVICILLLCSKPAIAETPALITHLNAHTLTHTLELKPIPSSSYKLAKTIFLPELQDSEIPLANIAHRNDNCTTYPFTSCPAHGICSSCSFDRQKLKLDTCQGSYIKNDNTCVLECRENETTFKSIPRDYKCTTVNTDRDSMFVSSSCYYGCTAINCSGYTLDCTSIDKTALHIANTTICPDCSSSKILKNCSKTYCKISSCTSGYKIASNGTTCVPLDDTCPANYFKTCETGTTGDPEYTETGTACYQCKAKTPTAGMPILYSDLTVSATVITGKTPIGIVFDESKKLALALNTVQKAWSTETQYFDIPDLTNYSSAPVSDYNGKSNTKTILTYCIANSQSCQAAEYANTYATAGTSAGDWYLPAFGELDSIYNNKAGINISLSKIGSPTLVEDKHWSSSEYDSTFAWIKYLSSGTVNYGSKRGAKTILPVIDYGNLTPACSVPNCSECIEKSEDQCKTCETGYTLSNGKCNETASGLPILYSDLTTSKDVVSGKTPIGIVFDEERKLAVALDKIVCTGKGECLWSVFTDKDIDGLNYYKTETEAITDFAGRENTKIIVDFCKTCETCSNGINEKNCPAAENVNEYATKGTVAGDWHLPSLGELDLMSAKVNALEAALSKVGNTNTDSFLSSNALVSSTVYSKDKVWYYAINGGSGELGEKNSNSYGYVRPVIDYNCRPDDDGCPEWRQYDCRNGCGGTRKCCTPDSYKGYQKISCTKWTPKCTEEEYYENKCNDNDECLAELDRQCEIDQQTKGTLPDDAAEINTAPDGCLDLN